MRGCVVQRVGLSEALGCCDVKRVTVSSHARVECIRWGLNGGLGLELRVCIYF
jgi:hypothetical protein